MIQNQYQCKSCTKKGKTKKCPLLMHYVETCKDERPSRKVVNKLMKLVGEGTLSDVGCTSHSKFQSDWEKVLDELLNWKPGYKQYRGNWIVKVDDLYTKIEELRQKVIRNE